MQTTLACPIEDDGSEPPSHPMATLLDTGTLPVQELARLAQREGQRPRPIYQAHRWFARRFGSAFRALLTAAALPDDAEFWPAYYAGATWRGKKILDPFVGGGTSTIESLRLGADAIGVDIDPVACAITRFEASMAALPDLRPALATLKRSVGEEMRLFYRTVGPDGGEQDVVHFFWVQVVTCRQCGREIEAHPRHQLAYEAEGNAQWAFCPRCHAVHRLGRAEDAFACQECGERVIIGRGTLEYGRLTCPSCRTEERLIDVAGRTGRPPRWRLFALEVLTAAPTGRSVPMARREFRAAGAADEARFAAAAATLQRRRRIDGSLPFIPQRRIPSDERADDRLIAYGYRRYRELFNPRQLLHLSCLAEAIDKLDEPIRGAMAIAFSDHLTTTCMMTHYAFGWRRAAPLFSVRAYRHVARPVEVNPWLEGTGRGTFPNAVHQVRRAIEAARSPREPMLEGGFQPVRDQQAEDGRWVGTATIVQGDAKSLAFLGDEMVDLVLTDPPYYDMIPYTELADFFLPWLHALGAVEDDGQEITTLGANLAVTSRSVAAGDQFVASLAQCFREIERVLKPSGRLVFTFQHRSPPAWHALARALARVDLLPITTFPLFGDKHGGLHEHEGNIRWDAVLVFRRGLNGRLTDARADELRLSEAAVAAARTHHACWLERLVPSRDIPFRGADSRNLYSACLVVAALRERAGHSATAPSVMLETALLASELPPGSRTCPT